MGGVTYTVNANGNLTARGSDSFGYDQANRLTSASVGATSATYAYDGDGTRVSTTVGSATTHNVYDIAAGLPLLLDDGTRKYVYGLGLAYSVDTSGTMQVYHADGLGSARAITDTASPTPQVAQTYQGDEFGIPTVTQGTSGQPFQYAGEPRDAETGLVYLRARMYDPSIARLLQADPRSLLRCSESLGRPISFHRFLYADDNPINRIDPSGTVSRIKTAESRTSVGCGLQFVPGPILGKPVLMVVCSTDDARGHRRAPEEPCTAECAAERERCKADARSVGIATRGWPGD